MGNYPFKPNPCEDNLATDTEVDGIIKDVLKINDITNPKDYIYIWNDREKKHVIINKNTGELIHELDKSEMVFSKYKFTDIAGDVVCEAIRLGKTLTQIGLMNNMPGVSTIYHWRRTEKEFCRKMDQALKDRANHFHDQVLEKIEKPEVHKDDVPYLKVQLDALKWAAEKADPEKFGNRKENLQVVLPSIIVLGTGIDRENAPTLDDLLKRKQVQPAVEAEFKNIGEKE